MANFCGLPAERAASLFSQSDLMFTLTIDKKGGFPSPFHEQWWLNAATNGKYDIIEIRQDGVLRASMPFYKTRRLGLTSIRMPQYTRTLGPILNLPPSKPFKHGQNIRNIVSDLVRKLPEHDSIRIRLDPADETTFGFSLLGFSCEEQFTFRIPPSMDLNEVWKNCDQKTRNVIRAAEKKLSVQETSDFSEFRRLSLLNRTECENTHDFARMENIFYAAHQRGQASILTASNESGKNVASVIIVWGAEYAYFWQSARDPASGIGGANAVLLWKSAEMVKSMGLTLDFDSYGSVKSAKFLASFGLPPLVLPEIIRDSARFKLLKLATTLKQQWGKLSY